MRPLLLGFLLLALTLAAGTATAATAVKLDMPHLVERSQVILVAQVTQLTSQLEQDGRVYTTIHLRTEEAFKGQPRQEFALRQVGGRHGDIATQAPGMPDFQQGEFVFLFLRQTDSFPVVTGLSQGKFKVALGPDESTRYVIPQVDGLRLIAPQDAPPRRDHHPAALTTDLVDHQTTFQQVHEYEAFRDRVLDLIADQEPTDEQLGGPQ